MKNYPVFIFPISLEFYLGARHTYKQLLTLYNPYDFTVNFKVLCTAPTKFTVIDPEGVIAPQSCIDIVVRYTQPSLLHCNTTEKFRITMYDRNTQQALGKRDIPTKLIEGEPASAQQDSMGDNFQPLMTKTAPTKLAENPTWAGNTSYHSSTFRERPQVNHYVLAIIGLCLTVIAVVPTTPEEVVDSRWPEWLQICVMAKIFASFLMGAVFMNTVRP